MPHPFELNPEGPIAADHPIELSVADYPPVNSNLCRSV